MLGITLMAIITTCLAFGLIGGIITFKSPNRIKLVLFLVFLANIPIFFFAYFGFRLPLDEIIRFLIINNDIYGFIKNFYAPITEEASKLLVFLPLYFFRKIDFDQLHWYAFAAGLGFGTGEIWFLASVLALDPYISSLPWYFLSGFLIERLCVCFLHGSFLYGSLYYISRKKYVYGLLYGFGFHLLTNFPIYASYVLNLQENMICIYLLSFWVIIMGGIMFMLTSKLYYGKLRMGYMLMGQAECPECGSIYDRPFFGINLVTTRIERCPHCNHFHRVKHSIKKEDEIALE